MIKSGRYGQVMYDPAGTTPVEIMSLNKWKLSIKTDHLDVTCFGDDNKVYVPGMRDISGEFNGFWNSEELTLFEAAEAATPGLLKLVPNETEAGFYWTGKAYLDAEIETAATEAPKVTGSFMAAASWTGPAQP